MAEEKNSQEEVQEEKVQDTAQNPETEKKQEEPKKEPYKSEMDEDGTIKLDLRKFKKEEDATEEQSTDEVPVRNESETSGGVQEQNIESTDEKPSGESDTNNQADEVLELVDEEETTLADKIKDIPNKLKEKSEDVNNIQEVQPELPENINKLVDFMKETGGTLEDYVNLNKDYADMEDMQILREHYRQSKPHLTEEEIIFLIEDSFSYYENSE